MIEELTAVADEVSALLEKFVDGGSIAGLILPTEYQATFKSLALEAKSIIDGELRPANDFSMAILRIVNAPSFGMIDGPSYAGVNEVAEAIRGAARTIARQRARAAEASPGAKAFVDPSRIVALQGLQSGRWDFTRLTELCRELNVAAANRCHMSTAMLLRTMLNHVPPVLGCGTFEQVANNYGGPKEQKSFKHAMQRLQGSLRAIADMHLHSPIRAQEDVPTGVQVDFAAELDVLLGELIRVARQQTE